MIVAGNKSLFIDGEQGIKVMQALGNETRLLMLSLLSHRSLNLSALAEAINLPSRPPPSISSSSKPRASSMSNTCPEHAASRS